MAKADKAPSPNRKRKEIDVTACDASRCRASYRRGSERPDRPRRRQRFAAKDDSGLLEDQRKLILLNLADVDYIDSSGIGELVSGFTAVKNQSGDLKLLHLTKKVRDLLQITKLYTVFDVFTDESTALRSFR